METEKPEFDRENNDHKNIWAITSNQHNDDNQNRETTSEKYTKDI